MQAFAAPPVSSARRVLPGVAEVAAADAATFAHRPAHRDGLTRRSTHAAALVRLAQATALDRPRRVLCRHGWKYAARAYLSAMTSAAASTSGSEVWEAIGALSTVGTLIVAVGAAIFAWRQLKISRDARLDQTRPYVMVTLEQGLTWFQFIDLVVVNVGAGPARDVTITVDPPLASSFDGEDRSPISETRYFTEAIPLMPPNYRMRTFFDDYTRRYSADLPSRFTFTLSYNDGHGNTFNETVVQDLGIMNDLEFTQVYGIHDAAKALREIEKHLKKSPLAKGRPLEVTTEDRQTRDERLAAAREQRRKRMEEWARTGHQEGEGAEEPPR